MTLSTFDTYRRPARRPQGCIRYVRPDSKDR